MAARSLSRRRTLRGGFSLIETLVSITLLGIGLVGVAGAMCCAAKTSRIAEDRMVAESLAASLLAETRRTDFASLTSWYTYPCDGTASGGEQSFATRLAQSHLPSPQAWLTVTNVQQDLKGVTVLITWGTGSGWGSVAADTLVSPRF